MCVNSASVRSANENAVSVTVKLGATVEVFRCSVVPQASKPCANEVAVAALQVVSLVAITLITTEVGIAGVKVLLINDFRTDKDCKALGVTEQVQQETISSCGS